jgi:hypothetical protein
MTSSTDTVAASIPLPRHIDLVEERLVRWYFYAALTFIGISMLGGILMALQLVHWNPLRGIELFFAGGWSTRMRSRTVSWRMHFWECCIGWCPAWRCIRSRTDPCRISFFSPGRQSYCRRPLALLWGRHCKPSRGLQRSLATGTSRCRSGLKVWNGARRRFGLTLSRWPDWHWSPPPCSPS